ncbi:uncharacterized protein B0I36DRAFT_257395 [Microdochium trichocladiopsis]|uniref:Uncharacterized protein n=1 Tax=Microdochium trichocladiopsis TaxID=1682393 RepID=A0A9P8XQ25_9PEZI|nr:uncharacterized protein B0I36DRAFT_257395 [Microdochium trichocladiopsis]KAH7010703.1 hypothetical protein B0I36DRAFT_257395 [Microdochium trichocladiopsis]
MKRQTTKSGAPTSKSEATRAWNQCWKDLPQAKIQAWIERIPFHIQEVIRLEGGNEYREGRRIRPESNGDFWDVVLQRQRQRQRPSPTPQFDPKGWENVSDDSFTSNSALAGDEMLYLLTGRR